MESEKVNDIVEETFTKVDLSVMNKHHGLNWKGQLQAVLIFVPGCGGFLAQELQNYLDYRDNEFLRKYTTYIMELSDMWRKRSIPTHSEWLYPLTFDAGKGLKEA